MKKCDIVVRFYPSLQKSISCKGQKPEFLGETPAQARVPGFGASGLKYSGWGRKSRLSGTARKGLLAVLAPEAGGREQAFLNMSHSSPKHLYIGGSPFKIS